MDVVIEPLQRNCPDGTITRVTDLMKFHAGKSFTQRQIIGVLENGLITVAVTDDEERMMVGVLLVALPRWVDLHLLNQQLPAEKQLDFSTPTLQLDDLIVHRDYRNNSIGTSLVRDTLAGCQYGEESRPFPRAIALSRVPENGGPSSYNLLLGVGFQDVANMPDGWYDDNPDFLCPYCGIGCNCEARLMVWERREFELPPKDLYKRD